jgi:hypothetical protein
MSVRGVRGGKAGGAGGARGASSPASAGKAAKAGPAGFGAKVDKAERLVGPSGAASSGNASGVAASDPVVGQVLELARQLKAGQIKSREEATKKLVADILRDKVRSQSKHLSDKVFQQLRDDPQLSQTLDRLWKRAENEE